MSYITLIGGTVFSNTSYTIRGFTPDVLDSTVTILDKQYHSSSYLGNLGVGSATYMPEVVREGWTGGSSLTQTILDGTAYVQNTLDVMSQSAIEGGSYTSVNIDGTYNNGFLITNVGTTAISSESKFDYDNLTAAPFAGAGTYYIQMPVWSFPPSSTADLANCSLTFSSSDTYAVGQTVTIPFSSTAILTGTATIAAGGNFTWKINRDYLANNGVDITKLRKVKVNMKALTGTFNFIAEGLKLVPSNYSHYNVGVNTKTGRFKQERWPGTAQSAMPAIVQNNFTAKDYTHIVRFNSGNMSGTANPNEFSIYHRVNTNRVGSPNSYLRIRLVEDSTQVRIEGYEGASLIFSQGAGPLNVQKEHTLITTLSGGNVRVALWESVASRLQTLKLDTNKRPTTINQNGYVGFDFKPYYGNFQIDFMYCKDLIVGEYISNTFQSFTPVEGVTIYPKDSPPQNLLTTSLSENVGVDNLIRNVPESGQQNNTLSSVVSGINDVYVTSDTKVTVNGTSTRIDKNLKNAYIATLRYPNTIVTNDLSLISVSGYLRYEAAYDTTVKSDGTKGTFRVVLWDKWYQKPLYIGDIQNIAPNKWNYFEVPIIASIYTNEINFEIQHCGTVNSNTTASFWLEDVEFKSKGIIWEASNNNGNSWTKFYDNVNNPFKIIYFPNDIYDQIVKNNSPKIYWKLNETSGPIAQDFSYSSNNGVYGGTANITFGVAGTEIIKTDPSNNAVRMTSGGSVYLSTPTGLSTAAVTVNTWIRTGTALAQDLVIQSGTANGTWKLQTTPAGINFNIYNGGSVALQASAAFNYYTDKEAVGIVPGTPVWHNVTARYNSSYVSLYIDGQLVANTPGTIPLNATALIVSNGPSSGYRYQDEIEVYPSALTEDQIVRLYNAGVSTYNQLKIRARAYTTDAWIGGYEVVPYYAKPGKYLERPNLLINPNPCAQGETFDGPSVSKTWAITPNSITPAESVSNPDVFKKAIYPNSITSAESVPTPTVNQALPNSVAYRGVAVNTGYGVASVNIPSPTGIQNGDILVLSAEMRYDSGVPFVAWPPSGWTAIGSATWGSTRREMRTAWKVHDGSSLGLVNWTGAVSQSAAIGVIAYSGGTGVQTYSGINTVSGATNVVVAGTVTTTTPNTFIILTGYFNDYASAVSPAGYTTRIQLGNTYFADKAQAATAVVAPGTVTYDYNDFGVQTIVVR